jgi:hypothetical protein
MNKTNPSKGEARLAVEEALKTGTREQPITALEISAITGLSLALVRTHVSNCCNCYLAHNVMPAGQPGAAYAWGMRPDPRKSPHVAQPRQKPMMGTYTGERTSPAREGSDVAFTLPSLWQGKPQERRRPVIISMRPEVRT